MSLAASVPWYLCVIIGGVCAGGIFINMSSLNTDRTHALFSDEPYIRSYLNHVSGLAARQETEEESRTGREDSLLDIKVLFLERIADQKMPLYEYVEKVKGQCPCPLHIFIEKVFNGSDFLVHEPVILPTIFFLGILHLWR